MRLVHIGFGNYLDTDRIIAIAVAGSAPIKRSIQDARDKGLIIDLTEGHRVKSVVFTDCNHVVLLAMEPGTIEGRVQ